MIPSLYFIVSFNFHPSISVDFSNNTLFAFLAFYIATSYFASIRSHSFQTIRRFGVCSFWRLILNFF
ncbi:hypothetical protein HanRHA438_Chr04g0173671 [Helianthus annuus]|nr:hypothetical protein HanIR_Chr04g0176841 [Helianthus annuus]KAJ0926649.1 hypothetical protein HanRHA438_Chr04g0173671 [Helianthus annuus]